MTPRQILLRIVLVVLCAYHLGIGVISCVDAETTVQIGQWLYGLNADTSPATFAYMLKALGMYALFTGALAAVALANPVRYRGVILLLAALLVMRATTRLVFFETLHEAFQVGWGRNLLNVALMSTKAAVLLWACPVVATSQAEEEALSPLDRPVVVPRAARNALASASRRLGAMGDSRLATASGLR